MGPHAWEEAQVQQQGGERELHGGQRRRHRKWQKEAEARKAVEECRDKH